MLKRDDFITIIRAFRNASPTISNEQRKGLLRQAVQNYDLSVEEATEILQSLGLVVGGEIDYFNVLGFSLDEIQSLDETTIASHVEVAHKNMYGASLRAGGRPRADGRTEEQWRTLLNQARDTLIDVEKREAHIAFKMMCRLPLNLLLRKKISPQSKRLQFHQNRKISHYR
jgi:hypothetical protein